MIRDRDLVLRRRERLRSIHKVLVRDCGYEVGRRPETGWAPVDGEGDVREVGTHGATRGEYLDLCS